MNKEIKEIIKLNCNEEIEVKYFAKDDSIVYTTMDYSELLDYITNLQEENEKLKENAEHNDKVVDKARWNEMIYKSRNEKAIEYIKIAKTNEENDNMKDYIYTKEDLLNILQGEDKNE